MYYHILSYIIILSYVIIYHHIYIYSNDILSFHTKHSHFVVYLHVHHFHPFSLSPPCAIAIKILLGHSHKRTLHLPEYW
jgi:succinate dehydrogenase/fumarate reductase flavoprotein subunit